MENFAEQCLDMARSILSQNLDAIEDNGTIRPFPNENATGHESGHAAFAIGEYFRATNEDTLDGHNLFDLQRVPSPLRLCSRKPRRRSRLCQPWLTILRVGKDRNPIWELCRPLGHN